MKVFLIAGARPNFMKIAPLMDAIKKHNIEHRTLNIAPLLVHTGQHYDENMSNSFFEDLELPRPDVYLGVGSGSHAEQTAKIMMEFEKVCTSEKPNLVMVVGDVNSTLACSIVAAKLCIPVAHVEAGLRSFDRTMPEEINRVLVDAISDYLFTTCEDANENLRREGIPKDKIYFVGNVMIDTLLKYREKANRSRILDKLGLNNDSRFTICDSQTKPYALLTLHRPSNVDDKEVFRNILEALQRISKEIPIIFPAHPRTKKQIKNFGFKKYLNFIDHNSKDSIIFENSINLLSPLPYLDFLSIMANAKFVLTDSGGIQEETTILNIPCLTLRENTERPVTVGEGTNTIVGNHAEKIILESMNVLNGKGKVGKVPKLWDGKAAERISEIFFKDFSKW